MYCEIAGYDEFMVCVKCYAHKTIHKYYSETHDNTHMAENIFL